MIGTTFKLGFDGTSVKSGLGGMSRLLGNFGKQMAIGAARRVGERVTDLLGRIILAAPQAMKETADWAGNMTDMSAQTGVSIESLVLLEEKLRLVGGSVADTSKMISTLADNLYEAGVNGGPAKDALNLLGFYADEFKGMKVDEAFEKIGEKVAKLGPDFKGLETIMADLFGARMGYKLIRYFRDVEGSTAQAKNNVGKLAAAMDKGQAASLDRFSDAMGRWETMKRSMSSIVLDEIFRVTGGAGGVDRMFNFLDPEKLRPKIQEFMSMLGRNLEVFLSQDLSTSFGDVMKNLGKSFGEGIRESFKFDAKSLLPSWLGGGSTASTDGSASQELRRQTEVLTDIRRTIGTPTFA